MEIEKRPPIPAELRRAVSIESGHRCAIPTCKYTRIEIAHIIPWVEVQEHKFENLIALCPNCHDLYDKDKKIDRKSMLIYKANLGILSSRYQDFEHRVLLFFYENIEKKILKLPPLHDLHLFYLLKDKIIVKRERESYCSIDGIPSYELYELTSKGKQFIDNWKEGNPIS